MKNLKEIHDTMTAIRKNEAVEVSFVIGARRARWLVHMAEAENISPEEVLFRILEAVQEGDPGKILRRYEDHSNG